MYSPPSFRLILASLVAFAAVTIAALGSAMHAVAAGASSSSSLEEPATAPAAPSTQTPSPTVLPSAVPTGGPTTGPTGAPTSAPVSAPRARWGYYGGPGDRTVEGAAEFAKFTGLPVTQVVEYPPHETWLGHGGLTGPSWVLDAHRDSGYRLEYSLPMLPEDPTTSLADCAAGDYNTYWIKTANNLMRIGHRNAIIRPGWEMNGTWYRWSAANGNAENYAQCFRNIVTSMRVVAGNAFTFDWNVNIGFGAMAAEDAYPGDAYVDYVGVDVYDMSWTWYPTPAGVKQEFARQQAWNWLLKGDHGLRFWSNFAREHKKKMALPEWGMTSRADEHGGGDNPIYLQGMLDFIADPANNVAYSNYFNLDNDEGTVRHDVSKPGTLFAETGGLLQNQAREWGLAP